MSDDPNVIDPMQAILERRRKLVADADRFLPKPRRYRRGDIESRMLKRRTR